VSLYGPPSDHDGEIGSGCGIPAASGPKERSIMHSISAYVMRQSYIGMLIVMMVSRQFVLYIISSGVHFSLYSSGIETCLVSS